VAAAVALAAWLVARAWDRHAGQPRRRRRVLVYALASPLLALLLFLCFENVDRVLPAF
jgi:hypothetical protein